MTKFLLVTHSRSRLYSFHLFQVIYVVFSKDNGNSVIYQTECERAAPEPMESRMGGIYLL